MSVQYQVILREQELEILDKLQPLPVLSFLYKKEIISDGENEGVKDSKKKSKALFDLILSKSDHVFVSFQKALRETGQQDLAQALAYFPTDPYSGNESWNDLDC